MKHLGAEGGKLEHFVIGYFVELFGVFDNSRVGGINAVHIGINMAGVGLERRGDGNGSRVEPPLPRVVMSSYLFMP